MLILEGWGSYRRVTMRFITSTPIPQDLRTVPLFRECTLRQLRFVDRLGTRAETAAGAVLCREGEIASQFIVIMDGRVRVERVGRRVASLGPGETFGELTLLARNGLGRRTPLVTTEGPTRVMVFTRREFNSLVCEVMPFTRRLLEQISNQAIYLATENLLVDAWNAMPESPGEVTHTAPEVAGLGAE